MTTMTNNLVLDAKAMTTVIMIQTIQMTTMSTDATAGTKNGTATVRRAETTSGTTGGGMSMTGSARTNGRRERTERTMRGETIRGTRRPGSELSDATFLFGLEVGPEYLLADIE
jgi:hypothetical protein